MSNLTWEEAKERIIHWLSRRVPSPAPPVPKPQHSFHTLRPGQRLRHRATGMLFDVVSVDSSGALLGPPPWSDAKRSSEIEMKVGKDWRDHYERVRIPRRTK